MPKISVIIPTYNRAHTITKAINSVLNQTFKDFELIVVDDGSTDDTKSIIGVFEDSRIRYVWQENQERSAARNTGLRLSQGKYISFLDSDDEYLSEKLHRQVSTLDNNPSADLVMSGWYDVDSNGIIIFTHSPWVNHSDPFYSLKDWLLSPPVNLPTCLLRKKIVGKSGGFDTEFNVAEDVDFLFRLIKSGCNTLWAKSHVLKYYKDYPDINSANNNYKKLIGKVFSDPEIIKTIGVQKSECLALVNVTSAYHSFLKGDTNQAKEYLTIAIELDPNILDQKNLRLLNMVTSGVWHPSVKEPVTMIENFYEHLPDQLAWMKKYRKSSLAQAWLSIAFREYRQHNSKNVLYACYMSTVYDHKLIKNRGLISIFLRSVI